MYNIQRPLKILELSENQITYSPAYSIIGPKFYAEFGLPYGAIRCEDIPIQNCQICGQLCDFEVVGFVKICLNADAVLVYYPVSKSISKAKSKDKQKYSEINLNYIPGICNSNWPDWDHLSAKECLRLNSLYISGVLKQTPYMFTPIQHKVSKSLRILNADMRVFTYDGQNQYADVYFEDGALHVDAQRAYLSFVIERTKIRKLLNLKPQYEVIITKWGEMSEVNDQIVVSLVSSKPFTYLEALWDLDVAPFRNQNWVRVDVASKSWLADVAIEDVVLQALL